VVQSLLANTSTQAFFSPDPEDADLIRAALSATVRYGETTLDLPTLNCWLRARIGGRWQPPTLAKIEPLPGADAQRTQAFIREVIAAHPQDYARRDNEWHEQAVRALTGLVPPKFRGLLSELLAPSNVVAHLATMEGLTATPLGGGETPAPAAETVDKRRLGF
jgi:hypothetical protein